eukprot:CAMPEP_0179343794 /NCGR_PEP_ID=MMETSP0797-20121207/71162_1 /TAXON_ID=47934 /ORGANISM="Dinophysis acuminata, Strain DAEP01" /LENGTH=35 /DNA_ID= /DNA_START= /DNA_END= /DNA_ORIENTATION=
MATTFARRYSCLAVGDAYVEDSNLFHAQAHVLEPL